MGSGKHLLREDPDVPEYDLQTVAGSNRNIQTRAVSLKNEPNGKQLEIDESEDSEEGASELEIEY